MSVIKSDCRKFSPNVFNKNKCQNCFRIKDTHSAEALENNRASRNVSKCGYLFVAPDWDFNVSINRTKRWQRRWFVLYDDGELTYSLDEFPDTIPQGIIDMNKALDVSDAENSTGNEFSISISTPDKVHFIKGTSKEESKWWFDVLSRVLPRHLSRGKHKRNATFPCGKATIPTTAVIAQDYCSEDEMIRMNNISYGRPKFLSSSEIPRNEEWISSVDVQEDEDVFGSQFNDNEKDSDTKRDVEVQNALNRLISGADEVKILNEHTVNQGEAEIQKNCLSQLEELDARRRNRRYLKRENRIQRNQRSRNDGVSKMIPSKNRIMDKVTNIDSSPTIAAAEKMEYLESIHVSQNIESQPNKMVDDKEISYENSISPIRRSQPLAKLHLRKSESLKNIPSETQSEMRDHVHGLRRHHSFKVPSSHRKIKPINGTSSLKRIKPSMSTAYSISPDHKSGSESNISSPPEICYEHSNESVFTRTGWLMRQTLSKDWSRHWFVLRDSSLTYYRDPSAENSGIMDGILDLNQVSTIRDTESDRYYAFSLRMWDDKKHILAAETDDFRSMWIQAMQYASNLWSSASKEDFICTEIVLPEHTFHTTDRSVDRISSPSSLSSLPYTGDNAVMETSYTSSDDQSEYFSLVDEDEISDLSSSPRTLPPSPPINRNMISLVKEKSRIRSSSGIKASTPTAGTEPTVEHSLDESHNSTFSHYKDAIDSMQLEKETYTTESSSETPDCDRMISPMKLFVESPEDCSEDTENIQFNLEFEDHLSKDKHTTERDYECHDESVLNSIPSESSSTSASESNKTNECHMCQFVKSKLVAAKEEIRRLKKELKEAHANFDNLEMYSYKLKQDIKIKEENYTSQIALMTAKIDDLTSKFTLAEKNYRQLKQKNLKSESKERKRSSLKSKEALSLTKEYELKLCDLEKKIDYIETTLQRKTPAQDSKSQQSETRNKNEECSLLSESEELCDTSTSTDVSSTSMQGFFSRLQSLGSKVANVNNKVLETSTSSNENENPKICLETVMEGFSGVNYSDDPFPKSLNNDITESLDKYPDSVSECKSAILHQINKILMWLRTSLDFVCRQGNENNKLKYDKALMLQSLVGVLSSFCLSSPINSELNQNRTSQAVMQVHRVVQFLEKIDDIDNFDCLIKLDIAKLAFKVILRTLCTSFAEYENTEMSNVLQFLSEVPQLRFFCPVVNNLFPKSQEEIEQFSSVSERLQKLNDEQDIVLNYIQTAKKLRYEYLWNTLTDIPVQDADINRTPQTINSILNYVTGIATYIHRVAEMQLSNVHCPSIYMFKIEQEKVNDWSSKASASLNENLTAFLSELKEQCPMLHESSVLVSELSETKRKEITCYVTELSFFSVSFSLLNGLLSCLTKVYETQSSFLCLEDLECSLSSNLELGENSQFFKCPQCTTLNNLLAYSEEEINWSVCVEKYKFYSPRKCGCFNYRFESLPCTSSNDLVVSNKKDVCNNVTCVECDNWINKFLASEKQHELERQALETKYNSELEQLEECLIKSSEVHEQEMLQKESELESTTAQLQSLKIEYEEQVKTLKNLYEQKLHFECDNIDEESIRQAYKSEVEDLKDMFKKGLAAIENSHYRITTEIEKRHKDEIQLMTAEKERALELEAQATMTALEAIKKSYEQQLKEETALIKEDLLKKFQLGQDYETFYSKYGGDLEKLKSEIVHITEMYSEKCIQNFALEEKVTSLRYQLEEAHNELCGLLKKNKEMDLSYVDVC